MSKLSVWWANIVAKIKAWLAKRKPQAPEAPQAEPVPTDPAPVPTPVTFPYDILLTVTGLTHSQVRFSWGPRNFNWPTAIVKVPVCATVEMRLSDGTGGKFDWIRKGGQAVKGLENVHNGYGVWGTANMPQPGEIVTFRWVSVDGKKRSNDAPAIWPE